MSSGKSRDPKTTHKIMSAVKSKDTKPELTLRKALWKEGLRYRVNYKDLPGKPDIVFTRWKLAIFVDGDFWHGHNWALRGMNSFEEELEGYSEYWKTKILRNIERDRENEKALMALGWDYMRFWESDIKTDVSLCVSSVKEFLFEEKIQSDVADPLDDL